jgi:RHS repeat-associated protein
MLDNVGVIHMNGRIYDSTIGRFMTADARADGAGTSQGWNRYTYVHNNPLTAFDPTGFASDDPTKTMPISDDCSQTGSRICGGGQTDMVDCFGSCGGNYHYADSQDNQAYEREQQAAALTQQAVNSLFAAYSHPNSGNFTSGSSGSGQYLLGNAIIYQGGSLTSMIGCEGCGSIGGIDAYWGGGFIQGVTDAQISAAYQYAYNFNWAQQTNPVEQFGIIVGSNGILTGQPRPGVSNNLIYDPSVIAGGRLYGPMFDVHLHPGSDPLSGQLSSPDVDLANTQIHGPVFIADGNGDFRVYAPGMPTLHDSQGQYAIGVVICVRCVPTRFGEGP